MYVANYFRSASPEDETRIVKTELPPIYFQHQGTFSLLFSTSSGVSVVCSLRIGHSMTIVGFEIRDNGSANLLVFDPMFKTSPAIERLIGSSSKPNDPTRLLKAYRRGTSYLRKFKIFEVLE